MLNSHLTPNNSSVDYHASIGDWKKFWAWYLTSDEFDYEQYCEYRKNYCHDISYWAAYKRNRIVHCMN